MTRTRRRNRSITREVASRVARAGRRLASRARVVTSRSAPVVRGPEAVYAASLDGDHLWLAVSGVAMETQLVLEADGVEVSLAPDGAEPLTGIGANAPAGVSLCADLLDLPLPPVGPGEVARFRILARGPTGVLPVSLPAPRSEDVTTTPRASRGWWQHTVDRDEAGTLVLQRRGHHPWAEVIRLAADDEFLHAALALPARQRFEAILLGSDGAELYRTHLRAHDPPVSGADAMVALAAADLPLAAGTGATLLLHESDTDVRVAVRRRHHELSAPDAAVSLPGVVDGLEERPLVRWRWSPDGTLGVQRPTWATGGRR